MEEIQINNLRKTYKDKVAVNGLTLTIHEGELFGLLGQNGAGKTTTIKMLCCLLTPTSGDAIMLGDSIISSPDMVKQKINVSPQETAVAGQLTVKENLELIAEIYGFNKEESIIKSQDMIRDFRLEKEENKRAKTLSGGMQRRLSIAMALISNPKIVFLDEPTLGLDVRARRDLWREIELLKGKVTIILTTHYLEEAEALCDRIAVMDNGFLKALGTSMELKELTNTTSLEDAFLKLTEECYEG